MANSALCCRSAALMLLVAVMEPDIGDSLPRIGDDHWVRFYMILGANGALAFLVRREIASPHRTPMCMCQQGRQLPCIPWPTKLLPYV